MQARAPAVRHIPSPFQDVPAFMLTMYRTSSEGPSPAQRASESGKPPSFERRRALERARRPLRSVRCCDETSRGRDHRERGWVERSGS